MAKGVPKSTSDATTIGRDAAGLSFSAGATGIGQEIGALISAFISPKIAKSTFGKNFNQMFAFVLLIDRLFTRFGKEAV